MADNMNTRAAPAPDNAQQGAREGEGTRESWKKACEIACDVAKILQDQLAAKDAEIERLREKYNRDIGAYVDMVHDYGESELALKEILSTLTDALRKIIKANAEFRDQLPDGWDGDSVNDACIEANATIAEAEKMTGGKGV